MRKRLSRTLAVCIFAVFFYVADGFLAETPYAVTVSINSSQNYGVISEVFRPGLMGNWSDSFDPLASPSASAAKKPFWRLHLGIQAEESLSKPADFEKKFQEWLKTSVDPQIKKYQSAGYKVVISITRVPKWLSLYPSDEWMPNGDQNLPKWAFSPPKDYAEWERLLQLLVSTQIQDGIRADYIIGDEPDWMFYGTLEQYLELYKHSVQAIKRVDPGIWVGGPAVGSWATTKRVNCPADQTGLPDGVCPAQSSTFIEAFIKYVSANSLPLDFIDWHFPSASLVTGQVNQTKSWLQTNGLPATTPLTIGEWVSSPAGETDSTETGSAYAIPLMKAMLDNGFYRHTGTSIYDQSGWVSGDWQHVGFFSPEGIIRSKWNSFKAMEKISGQRLNPVVSPDDERAIAAISSKDNGRIALLLASSSNPVNANITITNITPGNYKYRKYIIDGDMNEIHSNPCRFNKKTELAPSTSECGVNGAIDQAVARAKYEAQNATVAYMMSAGISQENANNGFVCYNDPTCDIVNFITAFCLAKPIQCTGKKTCTCGSPVSIQQSFLPRQP